MNFERTSIPDLWLIRLEPRHDERGCFTRVWCSEAFARRGIDMRVVQSGVSRTTVAGTVRGLHYQLPPAAEVKLVQCVSGRVFDVAVDLRPESSTYLRHFCIELDAREDLAVLIPEGVAHGCQALVDDTVLHYHISAPYRPGLARGRRFDDPALGIPWPMPAVRVSQQDRTWPLL